MKNFELTKKPIQTLDELTYQTLRQDCYYFILSVSMGDTYIICSLKEHLEQRYKAKIVFVTKKSHEAVLEMFEIKDYILCENNVFSDNFWYPKWVFTPNTASVPTLGKFYPAHPGNLLKDITHLAIILTPYRKNISQEYLEPATLYHLACLDLPQNIKAKLPTNLPQMSESLKAKISKIAPLEKIILFCPQAQSCPCLPAILFQAECENLQKQGYSIIVNIPEHKAYRRFFTEKTYELDLSLKECIALALSCAGVVSVRSGFVDLIAPHCENLTIYHTSFDFWWNYRFKGVNSRHLPKEFFVYDEPLYKEFLRSKSHFYEILPLRLYQRYATKGFLRKLRTPFALYFKLYKKYKGAKNVLSQDKYLDEFLHKNLAQTYEYQLGLALQKACENFFVGGFIFFAFEYLKIRKQKDKKFIRMHQLSEIFEPRKSLFSPENRT